MMDSTSPPQMLHHAVVVAVDAIRAVVEVALVVVGGNGGTPKQQ